jgi:cellulose biosynthesis protein BcsQ
MISTEVKVPESEPDTPIIHIFSLSSPRERVLLCLGLVRGFVLQEYSCLVIDFSFEYPLLSSMLEFHNHEIKTDTISDYYRDITKELSEDLIDQLLLKVQVTRSKKGFFNVFPATTSPAVAKEIDFIDDSILKKSTNKLRRFFRKIQEKRLFDIIIFNGQDSLNQETQNAMEIATQNFCLVHHSKYELEMIRKVISHFNNLHPYYHINGLLLNNYISYATQSKNQEYVAKLESELKVPVIASIDLLMNHLNSFPFVKGDWEADEYYKDLSAKILEGVVNPRIIQLEQPLILYSLTIATTGGLSVFTHFFKEGKHDETLMSGPLTVIISGISGLIGELLTRSQKNEYDRSNKSKTFCSRRKKI